MKPIHSNSVQIVAKTGSAGLSKAQKRFNSLIKKLDQQKLRIKEWSEGIPHFEQFMAKEYEPLLAEYRSLETQHLRLLDEAHSNPAFKKPERRKLSHMIRNVAGSLISGEGDDELKEIYNRHSDVDYDEEQRAIEANAADVIKSLMEDMLGMDLGHVDTSSPEKLQDFLHEQMQSERAERDARQARRKKSKRQVELEAQHEAERVRIKRSIQEIYRKLATQLHPDREPDPAERERKTRLMQEVNQAYAKRDLLALLELQLQAEQIDQGHINQIAEDRLESYNRLLKEQSDELQREIAEIEREWIMRFDLPPYAPMTPKAVMAKMRQDIQDLRYEIAMVKKDLIAHADQDVLKAWLKTYKIPKPTQFDDFRLGFEPFGRR